MAMAIIIENVTLKHFMNPMSNSKTSKFGHLYVHVSYFLEKTSKYLKCLGKLECLIFEMLLNRKKRLKFNT